MKMLQLTAALTLVLLLASTAGAQIVGSDHDFSNQTWTGGRICIVCHTAHNADITSVPGAPLWNHTTSTATYQVYTSFTFRRYATSQALTPEQQNDPNYHWYRYIGTWAVDPNDPVDLSMLPQQPNASSKLCLSCHDGTVYVDSFGDRAGTTYIGAGGNLGTDLRDDHPISIKWDHFNSKYGKASGKGDAPNCGNCHGIQKDISSSHHPNDRQTAFTRYGNEAAGPLPFVKLGDDHYVECSTCHEPHNNGGFDSMLRMTTDGSALCLHCHDK